jgi:hypothetical protein
MEEYVIKSGFVRFCDCSDLTFRPAIQNRGDDKCNEDDVDRTDEEDIGPELIITDNAVMPRKPIQIHFSTGIVEREILKNPPSHHSFGSDTPSSMEMVD